MMRSAAGIARRVAEAGFGLLAAVAGTAGVAAIFFGRLNTECTGGAAYFFDGLSVVTPRDCRLYSYFDDNWQDPLFWLIFALLLSLPLLAGAGAIVDAARGSYVGRVALWMATWTMTVISFIALLSAGAFIAPAALAAIFASLAAIGGGRRVAADAAPAVAASGAALHAE